MSTDRWRSYILFSIGNLTSLYEAVWPQCWEKASSKHKNYGTACNRQWVDAVDYLEVVGIIIGQIMVGVIGDW